MKLVIFDLDGVIVSTDNYHYLAWKALAHDHNFLFNQEMNHMLRGVSRAESLKILLDVNGRTVTPDDFQRMLAQKNDTYQKSLKNLSDKDILPGVLDLLANLKRSGVQVAIGSSSRNAPLILKQIGLTDAFDIIIDGNQITNSKPDPEVFLKAATGLGVSPKECVVYEDAEAGIEAALAAGMIAVGVGQQSFKDAHYTIRSLVNESYSSIIKQLEDKR